MTNLERFSKAIDWKTTDRILTWDFMDNEEVLIKYGGYDRSAKYTFEEIVSHVMDCTGKFSAYIARVYAEHASSPLLMMGEDICGSSGPIFSPNFLREQALPRWHWIMDPIKQKGLKFLFHTDGRYGAALPIIMEELNTDGLHPIERNGCNNIFEIRNNLKTRKVQYE